ECESLLTVAEDAVDVRPRVGEEGARRLEGGVPRFLVAVIEAQASRIDADDHDRKLAFEAPRPRDLSLNRVEEETLGLDSSLRVDVYFVSFLEAEKADTRHVTRRGEGEQDHKLENVVHRQD